MISRMRDASQFSRLSCFPHIVQVTAAAGFSFVLDISSSSSVVDFGEGMEFADVEAVCGIDAVAAAGGDAEWSGDLVRLEESLQPGAVVDVDEGVCLGIGDARHRELDGGAAPFLVHDFFYLFDVFEAEDGETAVDGVGGLHEEELALDAVEVEGVFQVFHDDVFMDCKGYN